MESEPYVFFEQSGMCQVGDETRRVVFNVPEGKPYPVGSYVLGPDSFFVDGFGRLGLRPVLVKG